MTPADPPAAAPRGAPAPDSPLTEAERRAQRLAAALRANLRRRKAPPSKAVSGGGADDAGA